MTSSLASSSGNTSSALANVPGETLRMAMAILGIGIVFAYPFFQRYFIKGLTIGAVKVDFSLDKGLNFVLADQCIDSN